MERPRHTRSHARAPRRWRRRGALSAALVAVTMAAACTSGTVNQASPLAVPQAQVELEHAAHGQLAGGHEAVPQAPIETARRLEFESSGPAGGEALDERACVQLV